jgi:hypothetical protein
MWRLIGKVRNPHSLLQDVCSFADCLILVLIALTARLEAVEKARSKERAALTEKKAAQLIAD